MKRLQRTALTVPLMLCAIVSAIPVTANGPIDTTICACNRLDGVSEGDLVTVTGVCTVESTWGTTITVISEPEGGPYCCGIAIYDHNQTLASARGQCVTVTGILQEYYDKKEIIISDTSSDFPPVVWDCGWKLPDPERIPVCDQFEPYESCIVVAEGLTVTSNPDPYGNILFTDQYGCEWPLLLRLVDPPIEPGTQICSITGLLDYHMGAFKLRPRDELDFDFRTLDTCPWTGTACDPVSIRSFITQSFPDCFQAGDAFIHTVTWKNLCQKRPMILIDILEVAGMYFFWPSFTPELNGKQVTLPELKSHWEEILHFDWPVFPGGSISGRFWSAAVDPATMTISGDIITVDFCGDGTGS